MSKEKLLVFILMSGDEDMSLGIVELNDAHIRDLEQKNEIAVEAKSKGAYCVEFFSHWTAYEFHSMPTTGEWDALFEKMSDDEQCRIVDFPFPDWENAQIDACTIKLDGKGEFCYSASIKHTGITVEGPWIKLEDMPEVKNV